MSVDPARTPTPSAYFYQQYIPLEIIGCGGFGYVLKVVPNLANGGFHGAEPNSPVSPAPFVSANGRAYPPLYPINTSPQPALAVKLILKDRIARDGLVRSKWESEVGLESWRAEDGTQDGTKIVPVEAYTLRKAKHAGVPNFIQLFACEFYYYLVMEHHGTPWRNNPQEKEEIQTPPSPPLTPPNTGFPQLLPFSSSSTIKSPSSSAMKRPALLTRRTTLTNLTLTKLNSPPKPIAPAMMRRSSSSDLFECIEQHLNFNESTARFIFKQILIIISDLRARGICHRDLKDENLVIDEKGKVKLIDFGSALLFNPQQPIPQCTRFYGTTSSAPPEVIRNLPYNPFAAEIWSLACLLHILVTGSSPFTDLQRAMLGQRSRVKGIHLSRELEQVFHGCLTVNSAERWTLEQLIESDWIRSIS